ncbi:hypothetical protein [Lysobacter sp. GCM10012299]|uniref:hypothetical protein n=1 Tax=Lysobacter sp. GCM10012299 TaxID=3317333 RepID=UPI003617B21E
MTKPKAPSTNDELRVRLTKVNAVNGELLDINDELLDATAQYRDLIETLLTAFAAEGSKSAVKVLLSLRMARNRTENRGSA